MAGPRPTRAKEEIDIPIRIDAIAITTKSSMTVSPVE
jgi:hypothetical protein